MRWVTERDAASIIHQSIRTLQRWRLIGDGPPFAKFGASVRYLDDPEGGHADSLQVWASSRVVRPNDQREKASA